VLRPLVELVEAVVPPVVGVLVEPVEPVLVVLVVPEFTVVPVDPVVAVVPVEPVVAVVPVLPVVPAVPLPAVLPDWLCIPPEVSELMSPPVRWSYASLVLSSLFVSRQAAQDNDTNIQHRQNTLVITCFIV
jgi:hypothetical protein